MGVFSWCTSDTRKSIPCTYDTYEGAPSTVYLLNPFGAPYKEDNYEGYGEFGGKDVYELVAEWNRKYLTPANIKKPAREQWPKGSDGNMFYSRALELYKGACEAIDAYAHGASDELMRESYSRYLSHSRDGSDWKRCLGIAIACYDAQHVKLKYPIKIVENPCDYEEASVSPSCPRQGCFYDGGLKSLQQAVDGAFERLEEAQDKYMGEKIDALCDFFWKSHMEDMIIFEDVPGHLVVRDEDEQQWEEGEIYDFVLNECLGFESDGKLQFGYGAISQELADTLKAHAAAYGVVVQTQKTSLDEKISNAQDKISDTSTTLSIKALNEERQ